ncbi:ras GTPase activator, partial [Aureobasidium melanogenum]
MTSQHQEHQQSTAEGPETGDRGISSSPKTSENLGRQSQPYQPSSSAQGFDPLTPESIGRPSLSNIDGSTSLPSPQSMRSAYVPLGPSGPPLPRPVMPSSQESGWTSQQSGNAWGQGPSLPTPISTRSGVSLFQQPGHQVTQPGMNTRAGQLPQSPQSNVRLEDQVEALRQHIASQERPLGPNYGNTIPTPGPYWPQMYPNSPQAQRASFRNDHGQGLRSPPPQAGVPSPAPTASSFPDFKKTTLEGYELLAAKLTDGTIGARPMYRSFEHLHHRLLLYLQDEICEYEEELRNLDEWISQIGLVVSEGKSKPASRRAEARITPADSELMFRRKFVLGEIFVKLERYPLYLSMNANPRELEIEDDLARAQKVLRDLKSKISSQSKKNFVLEKDVRYLDSRIALLVQNRMALEERNEVADHLDESDELTEGAFPNDDKTQKYGNLLFLLQSEPKHIAHLCRLVTLAEIDQLLQTVMFTIYGNQYESREEHLLLTMFQSVLTYQFDNTPDYSSLLRANTPVSRMMTTYTRRGPGQGYLKTVLSEQINYVTSKLRDVDLEINPLKVYETMMSERASIRGSTSSLPPGGITAEEAAANPQVQAIISRRVGQLIQLANYFLDTIVDGMDETPYGIRWICKQIRSLSRRKYPDAQDQTICTLIGGFFFLRFINPAIVTPRSYMLIEQNPAENPKRTLTLVAKMLQNLANKPSYAKEPYMSVLQPFIQQNKERMNKFLLDLCEVQDFYETLEMDNYVALSKKDLELPISLNEVYAMHALLEKHTQELVARDEGSHLKILLQDLGPAPAQLPRKENRAINLPLYSKWETALDDLTAALDITQEEVYFMEAKSTFVMILRSLPANTVVARRPLRLDRVAEAAATTKNDSVMVRKGIRSMELLSQLNDMGMIDKADNYASLRDEVEQELNHLGSLKDRVMNESQKLEEVYQTIRDHNAYLVGQLETYKSYLHNVRGQSEGTTKRVQSQKVLGPYKFTHAQLEKEGVIQKSNVPPNRQANIYFNMTSPSPGTFIISLHYKGRNRGLLELDLKLDDLLEMQKDSQEDLDLEYVQFNVSKLLVHLNKKFARKRGW